MSLMYPSSVEPSLVRGKSVPRIGRKKPESVDATVAIPGLFVTGTDTDVGKTAVATVLVRLVVAQGIRVGVYKPVASGVVYGQAGDKERLWEAAGRPLDAAAVCPQAFAAPLAPPHAARLEGRSVDEELLLSGLDPWLKTSDFLVVEGAGGLFSPLSENLLNADVARGIGLPLVVVDAARLGCIGRTLATCLAARSVGLEVAAIVLSHLHEDHGADASTPTSAAAIASAGAAALAVRLPGVAVTILGHGHGDFTPTLDWLALGRLSAGR
ncbi:MAG: dethiobiotin synthase [Planctomycetota bacterium]|nr:MAG: dethiobiotin synthase [Planctomycetota bacterium]